MKSNADQIAASRAAHASEQVDDTKRLDWLGFDYTGFDHRISLIWEGRKNGMGFRESIDAAMRKET